jgi:hypothetical protein
MKPIRACLLVLLVAFASPASAEPIAIGEFAFNLADEFGFLQFFSIANTLAPDHPLADLVLDVADPANLTIVPIGFDLLELPGLSLFDFDGNGIVGPGESAQTFADFFSGAIQFARLDFGGLVGFSAGVLTVPPDLSDPTAGLPVTTIFYDPEIASVPEPGTLLLLGSGLAFAALRGRRRHV